ncbi:MAG: hypothetical protein JWO75_2426 [Actinomycetia bacterium]|nr:hypothetical protein [Actinomycetes bacterium]
MDGGGVVIAGGCLPAGFAEQVPVRRVEGQRTVQDGGERGRVGGWGGAGGDAFDGDPPKSEPALGRAPSSAEVEPDEEMRGLLTLLAVGLTDAAIARNLGWSVRTTQRRIQRLMQVLGASTRFQASLAAARRGWL